MSHTYERHFREHVRASIVQFLSRQPDYEANHRVLAVVVRELGLPVSGDQVLTEIGWLRENHLVTVRTLAGLQIPQLTQRGLEVAEGHALAPGVARPQPKA